MRMTRLGHGARYSGCLLAALAVSFALPATARAQAVQGCQPGQFLDRSAAGADRQLNWDFSISNDPERCLQVQTGQVVVFQGDFETHPLAGSGGDQPNPFNSHHDGSVTFDTPGTFGFQCLSHSPMKGAIKVVLAAPGTPAPAASQWLTLGLGGILLIAGCWVLGRQRNAATYT